MNGIGRHYFSLFVSYPTGRFVHFDHTTRNKFASYLFMLDLAFIVHALRTKCGLGETSEGQLDIHPEDL